MHNLMKLMSRSGAIRNCLKMDAISLLASGDWIDITKRGKLNEIRNQKSKNEPKHESDKRESGGICSANMPASEIIRYSESSENGPPKKRGRPPKKDVLKNILDTDEVRKFSDATNTEND